MTLRLAATLGLLIALLSRIFAPEWRGVFREPADISADAQAIIEAILAAGFAVLVAGFDKRS
ncbi:MAG: hypothetical protein AAF865_17215 [Pseudomonadota bacterium]